MNTQTLPQYQGQLENGQIPSSVASKYAPLTSNSWTPPAPTIPATSSSTTIVTSGQSRLNYADNVNTLQTAKNNIALSNANPTALTTPDKQAFVSKYAGTTAPNGKLYTADQLSGIYDSGNHTVLNGGDIEKGITDSGPKVNADGTSTNADGSVNPAGTTSVTDPKTGTTYAGINSVLVKAYSDAQQNLDQQVADAKATLDQAKATLANDPAAQAAIDQIKAKYDVLVQQMQAKNAILIGSQKTNLIRNGSLQYANEMNSNFMSEEMDKASGRVADLVTQETQMILKAQQAYKSGDLKALNDATKAYDDANKAKMDSITKLLDETDKAVKTQQAQAKIDAAAAKQQTSDDIRISTSIAQTMADTIAESGVTDEVKIDEYISAMAEKSGIQNLDVLKSAVSKAQVAKKKSDLAIDNTQSIIDKRKKTGTGGTKATGGGSDGGYKYTGDDVSTYTSFLNKGGQAPDGTSYAARGKDGYVDPGAYAAIYSDWVAQGGTPAGFLKKFPITNVNPDGRDNLPAALTNKK